MEPRRHAPHRWPTAVFGGRALKLLAVPAALGLAVGLSAVPMAGAAPASTTLRVGCGNGAYTSIGAAITAATSGDTIVVCPGTYHENVVVPVTKSLTIEGLGHAVVDATSTVPAAGVQVLADTSTIEGLTVQGAMGEGILVGATPGNTGTVVSGVTVRNNVVMHNDQGNPTTAPVTTSPYAQCNQVTSPPGTPAPPVPGDCGEAIHLLSASDSTVVGNVVTQNAGGILLTDENGPTSGNVIWHNTVSDNPYDCGITMASHNIKLAGGVYGNQILGNQITGNGTTGQGGGVLIATPVPGTPTTYGTGGAVYTNIIAGNHITGNGLAAVTVHSHAPGQDLNGNVITGNHIGTNNLAPDFDYYSLGYYDGATTGVIVATLSDITITIQDNVIMKNTIGVWLAAVTATTAVIDATGLTTNVFPQVTTPISTAKMP